MVYIKKTDEEDFNSEYLNNVQPSKIYRQIDLIDPDVVRVESLIRELLRFMIDCSYQEEEFKKEFRSFTIKDLNLRKLFQAILSLGGVQPSQKDRCLTVSDVKRFFTLNGRLL